MSTGKAKGSGLDWFIRRGAAVRGPFSSARVRHFVLEGKLELTDEVSADRQDWKTLGGVPEVVPLQMRDNDDSLSAQPADDGGAESGKAVRAMLIALAIIGVLTAGVYFASQEDAVSERDCAATPLPGINLEGCHLNGAILTAVAMPDARLANAVLADARLAEADLSRADMRYADLQRCRPVLRAPERCRFEGGEPAPGGSHQCGSDRGRSEFRRSQQYPTGRGALRPRQSGGCDLGRWPAL